MTNTHLSDISQRQIDILQQFKYQRLEISETARLQSSSIRVQIPSRNAPPLVDTPETMGDESLVALKDAGYERRRYRSIAKNFSAVSNVVFRSQCDTFQTTHRLTGILRLPTISSAYALVIKFEARLSALHWPVLLQSVSFKNVVPINARFMRACDAGDCEAVRDLAFAGEGGISDIDENGQPALHVSMFICTLATLNQEQRAIKSGSYRLVSFLLHNGADANELEGRMLEYRYR